MSIRFVALDTGLVGRLREGAPDANGHTAGRITSDGPGLASRLPRPKSGS